VGFFGGIEEEQEERKDMIAYRNWILASLLMIQFMGIQTNSEANSLSKFS